ncbi:cupredoxin domain-containing protein [Asticcacaulis solisilvae]|uniref:cupredoxin domain-containing protein n=1 Tax=Asticcacaulis solisilvae TaxID=1217274 RepID=UPI003FD8F2EA
MLKSLMFAAALAVAASPVAAAPAAHTVNVDIKNFMFMPMTVTIAEGDTVTWTNRDQIPHTVAEKNKLFRSAALDTGDTYSHVFDKAGTYDYFCTLHPQMFAHVVVTPAKKK